MKVKLLFLLASLALASGQLQHQLGQSSDQVNIAKPNRTNINSILQVNLPGESVASSSNLGGGLSWLRDGFNRVKKFGEWLVTSTNRNYLEHSDKVDFKISQAELDKKKGLKLVDTSVVGYSTPESKLNFLETLFRRGRGAFSESNVVRIVYETLGGFGACLGNEEWNDEDLGAMPLNATTWCDIRCGEFAAVGER